MGQVVEIKSSWAGGNCSMVLERLLLIWKHWQHGPQPPQQDLCLGTPGFWSDKASGRLTLHGSPCWELCWLCWLASAVGFHCLSHPKPWALGGISSFGHTRLDILTLPAQFVYFPWEGNGTLAWLRVLQQCSIVPIMWCVSTGAC